MDRDDPSNRITSPIGQRGGPGQPPRLRTHINSLPNDVLVDILRSAFVDRETARYFPDCQAFNFPRKWEDFCQRPGLGSPYDDRNPKHASAEYLASVCTQWREAMSGLSIFWSLLIVWLGHEPTPLWRIRQYLAWSRDQQLDIYVLRRFSPAIEDRAEKTHVKAIVDLLLPHIARWRMLYFALLHADSLPIPRVDLVGRAVNLLQLYLGSLVDDAVANSEGVLARSGGFEAPMVDMLSMGGVHYYGCYMNPTPQTQMFPNVKSLHLTDYALHHTPFPLVDLLRVLAHSSVTALYLNNMQFDCSYSGPPILLSIDDSWEPNVTFTSMTGEVIAEYNRLLDYPHPETTTYRRCTIPDCDPFALPPLGTSYMVHLEQIADPRAVTYYLTNVACTELSCHEASFHDCDGLQPEVLNIALGTPVLKDGEETWLCPRVDHIAMYECRYIRSRDIRAVLEARYKAHEATGFVDENDLEFEVLSVKHLVVDDCIALAPEDKQWFDTHMESVWWGSLESLDWRYMGSSAKRSRRSTYRVLVSPHSSRFCTE